MPQIRNRLQAGPDAEALVGLIQGCSVEERRTQWHFMMADNGWIWRLVHPDGTEQTSRAFKTLKECTEDATEHGYVVWRTESERRRGS